VNTTVRHIPGPAWYTPGNWNFACGVCTITRAPCVVSDEDDGRRSPAATWTQGYRHVTYSTGQNLWTTMDYATEWGVNVPARILGEDGGVAPCAHHASRGTIRPPATRRKIILLDSAHRKNTGAPRSRAAVVPRAVSWRCVFSRWCPIQTRSGRPLCRAHAQHHRRQALTAHGFRKVYISGTGTWAGAGRVGVRAGRSARVARSVTAGLAAQRPLRRVSQRQDGVRFTSLFPPCGSCWPGPSVKTLSH